MPLVGAALMGLAAAGQSHVPMESGKHNLRDDYLKGGRANALATHEVVFAVKQQNLDVLEQKLMDVSNPQHPSYGQYMSREAVANMTANPTATDRIVHFLNVKGAKVTKKTRHGEYISAQAPVALWEDIFQTEFSTFKSRYSTKQPVIRASDYSIPIELSDHVEAVFNTVQLPLRQAPKKQLVSKAAAAALPITGSITPKVLNEYYHISSNTGNSLASQCLFESLDQSYSPSDLSTFEANYNLPSDSVDTVIGGHESDSDCTADPNNCAEANLDVQYMIAVSNGTPTTYWYEDSTDSFLSWIQAMADMEKPPLVNSISYGSVEDELPSAFPKMFNTEAQKLGVQGVSILVSSGDDGVANFQARNKPENCGYHPSFPASSPYVTAIGATQGPESGEKEIACQSNEGGVITTGGGFSTIFSAPAYQQAAVKGYFATLPTAQQPVSGYATSGRGYPDVSMAGLNYEVVIAGQTYKVSGTSASAPVVAGMVSLVNAARLKAGKPALGFLNTALYQNGKSVTNDVTEGENQCTASKVCCDQGFYATAGWDPLTGYGSVDFQKFYNVFYNL